MRRNDFTVSFTDVWKIATTYIGTVVGAGFASGQEVLRFFSSHGLDGIIGIILSSLLFTVGGILVLAFSHSLKFSTYKELIIYVCGPRLGRALELLTTFFFFGTISVLLAGAGAVLLEQLQIPHLAGTFFTVILTLVTVLYGLKGIVRANSIVVPFLTIVCITVGIWNIDFSGLLAGTLKPKTEAVDTFGLPTLNWLISALLYVSYNMTLSLTVLVPLGRETKKSRLLYLGGIFGGLGLGMLISTINLSILSNLTLVGDNDVPMLQLAENLGDFFPYVYGIILWAEIFTTLISNLYGVTTRVSEQFNISYKTTLIIMLVSALFFSQIGFAPLVGFLYPLFGYFTLLFLVGLFTKPFRLK